MKKQWIWLIVSTIAVGLALLVSTNSAQASSETETHTIFLPLVVRSQAPTPEPQLEWLAAINDFRAQGNLPAVTENESWSNGAYLHSRYMVKTDVMAHTEDPGNPWFTLEGLAAAQTSDLAASYSVNDDHNFAISAWMQAPFHALGILDPALLQVGYGQYNEADGGLQMGASLDVIRGLGSIPPSVQYPLQWPADGKSVPLAYFWGEYPDPLTSCSGYSAPTGLPVILQIGSGNLSPNVTASSLNQGGTSLEHCVFDENSYSNPNGAWQSLGRGILDARDAVVLIPREPLTPGASYTVSITVNGQSYTWSFAVDGAAQAASGMEMQAAGAHFDAGQLAPSWIQ